MSVEIDVRSLTGLTEAEALSRLSADGPNELPSARERTVLRIAWDVVREPMFLLLVACGSIYLIVGDVREAIMLLGFVFIVMGITIYQERKTERALEALRDLSSPRALVIRDGRHRRIAGREVVRDDLLILNEGDRVPADATLLTGTNLSADESLLTGESVSVRKMPGEAEAAVARPGGDDLPYVYSGTMIVQGQGIARVHAVGVATEIGKIGKALQETETEQTRLQKATGGLVRRIAVFGAVLFAVVVVVYGVTRGDWLAGLLAGIAMAMAMLPEEFPVVLTIFLALGAWRIAQKRVLTRRIPAVETLGAATVLCVDKTGTLTQNRMSVSRLHAHGRFWDVDPHHPGPLPEEFHELVEYGILASKSDPFDPMEKALRNLGAHSLGQTEHIHGDWTLVHEYPLSRELLALSHVWTSPDGTAYVIAAKGAPEAIVDLCHLDEPTGERITRAVREMATAGLRVIGVAHASFAQEDLPNAQHDFQFHFLGLVGLSDPVRPTVPEAVRECRSAGIRVVMITGDYPETARAIARDIGLMPADAIITGPELERMDDAELRRQVAKVSIFARAVPEQKLRLVRALKANGEVVAMTGDGVNDAPALKAADIGIAMGERGTDVAREASSLVLLDDDFASIVAAVRLGRRIYDNLKKAMAYIFAIHVPIAGMSLIPVLFRLPLVLMPVHIVFLELIIDPACSVVFEAEREESGVMQRPPRDPKEPIFGRRMILLSLLQGTVVLAVVLAVYVIALRHGNGEAEARALTFTTLIISNLALILTNRSWSRTVISAARVPNAALYWVIGGAVGFLALVLRVPALRDLFHFAALHTVDLAMCLAGGIVSILWFEGVKLVRTRRSRTQGAI